MVWKKGELFLHGGGHSLTTGSKAPASFETHKSVPADFVMVAFATTE